MFDFFDLERNYDCELIFRNLKTYLPAEEFEQIKDAPTEWVTSLYSGSEVERFGGNITAARQFVKRLGNSRSAAYKTLNHLWMRQKYDGWWRDALHGEKFFSFNSDEQAAIRRAEQMLMVWGIYPAGSRLRAESTVRRSRYNLFREVELQEYFEKIILAIQARVFIDEHSIFTKEDYTLVTRKLRWHGMKVHPEDTKEGMVNFQV